MKGTYFNASEKDNEELQTLAEELGVPKSQLMRTAMREFIDRNHAKKEASQLAGLITEKLSGGDNGLQIIRELTEQLKTSE